VLTLSDDNMTQSLANMRSVFDKAVTAMPPHIDFVNRFCKAAPLQI